MIRVSAIVVILGFVAMLRAAEPPAPTFTDADARLQRAYALARESNDAAVIDRVLEFRDLVRRAFGRKDVAAIERLLRDAEEAAGLDPGGKTMLGLPVARIDPAAHAKLEIASQRLAAAMNKDDAAAVAAIVGESATILGDSAGVPDLRRRGETSAVIPIKPAEIAELFLKAIEADPRSLKALSAGVPAADALPRAYAAIVAGCVTIRPLVLQHHKDKVEVIDRLVGGCCKAMVALQTPAGHFKFPDLRGKNVIAGDDIDKLVDENPNAIRDGWVVVPFADGSSQIDAAACGISLLRAGAEYANAEWTRAGLAAADWSRKFPLAPAFRFNACTVSLLCTAHGVHRDRKYAEVAWRRYDVGVAPGQSTTGRWIDPHDARTPSHVIMLRAQHDLLEVSPPA